MSIHQIKTRIIATLGPSSNSAVMIEKLLYAGINVFRLNFSHGTCTEHGTTINSIRRVSKKCGIEVGILCDLQGPKIRTGSTKDDKRIYLKKGSIVELTSRVSECTQTRISINYAGLHKDVKIGHHLLLNDGAVCLRVTALDEKNNLLVSKVVQSGHYSSHKGVNFPESALRVSALTKKDKDDLAFILTQDIDFIALSFVRGPGDMRQLLKLIHTAGKLLKCIAKIEKPEAVSRLEAILKVCDGIMVARGDLGVEASSSFVPILQKDCIQAANRLGKTVIVATQMLESMIERPLPTRAETTDVANAIIDGADALMLSGETSVGLHPVPAVKTIVNIAKQTEKSAYLPHQFRDLSIKGKYPPHAICEAANWASRDLGNTPVVVFTLSGATADYLSKLRMQAPVFAFTPSLVVARSLSLSWNISTFVVDREPYMKELLAKAEVVLLKKKLVKKGTLLTVVCGNMLQGGATNLLMIKKTGEDV
ncbi:MAG: pyruvate kinase [Fibrobacteria bacterium]|nr:pyruvate kinase [Fibrobacteria bacterium]